MTDIICALCKKNQEIKELYPATFKEEEISPKIYSARRVPDRIHYRIVKCQRCGLIFSSPILPPEKIKNFYRESLCDYEEQIPYLTKTYLNLFVKTETLLPKNPKILEIGCGTGFFLEALREKGIKDVFGVEPSQKMISQASKEIKQKIKVDIFKKGQFPADYFDLICCFHTFDHLVNPHEFVEEAFSILKEGGLVLPVVHDTDGLSVKLFGERSPIFDIEHIYLFNKKTLEEIFKNYGFHTLEVFDVVNTYPLSYWLKMSGLPISLKNLGYKLLATLGLAKVNLSLRGGNIGILVQKPGLEKR